LKPTIDYSAGRTKNMDNELMLHMDLEMKFKAIIIDGQIVFSINKKDYEIEDFEGLYIIKIKK
jgi:hypothetical protein